MAGWLTNGLDNNMAFAGNELIPLDTAAGASVASTTLSLAAAMNFYSQVGNKTMVAGTVYFVGPYYIGQPIGGADVVTLSAPAVLTGVNVRVGLTGGTDLWGMGLYSSTGVLVASSNNSGVTAGTASTWMQLPFYSGSANTPYSAAPGVYWIGIQSNGTTATLGTYTAVTFPLLTGSKSGSFFNVTTLTIPTTYTANLGPQVFLY